MRFENAEAGITVQLGRESQGQGVGESWLYEVSEFSLLLQDVPHCSGEAGDIAETSYENTHHNWADRAFASLGDVRYELYVGLDPSAGSYVWAPTLSAIDVSSGAVVLEPIPLLPTGGPALCWECPGHVNVIVSEVMAENQSTLPDEHAEYEPWIELFNPSGEPINLAGWTLSNDLHDRTRWTLPDISIPRHGYVVLFADGQPEQGALHTNFRLSPGGGAFILTTPSGVTTGGQTYGPQMADRSFGYNFATAGYVWMPAPNPGKANPGFD